MKNLLIIVLGVVSLLFTSCDEVKQFDTGRDAVAIIDDIYDYSDVRVVQGKGFFTPKHEKIYIVSTISQDLFFTDNTKFDNSELPIVTHTKDAVEITNNIHVVYKLSISEIKRLYPTNGGYILRDTDGFIRHCIYHGYNSASVQFMVDEICKDYRPFKEMADSIAIGMMYKEGIEVEEIEFIGDIGIPEDIMKKLLYKNTKTN